MRATPFIVLVCLLFFIVPQQAFCEQKNNSIAVIVHPPTLASSPLFTSIPTSPLRMVPASGTFEEGPVWKQASPEPWAEPGTCGRRGRHHATAKPIVKCKGPSPEPCGPVCSVPLCPDCVLPRRFPGQWELDPQLFYATCSGTARGSVTTWWNFATDVNVTDDFGISKHNYLAEYTARYQFRPNWALHYSVMPFEFSGTNTLTRSIYFGGWLFPAWTQTNTKWQFLYQRVGLIYQPIITQYAIVSLFTYWLFNDQKLTLSSPVCSSTVCSQVNRTRNMVMSGIEIQKCIRTLPNAATLSCDNRVGLGYFDGTFLLDVQTGLQFSVPMNAGRWGYTKGGYRFIDFRESRDDLRWDTTLEGWFVELGMIF